MYNPPVMVALLLPLKHLSTEENATCSTAIHISLLKKYEAEIRGTLGMCMRFTSMLLHIFNLWYQLLLTLEMSCAHFYEQHLYVCIGFR